MLGTQFLEGRKKMSVLVSVIIPVYNVEKYLERCVKSVLNQTHRNLEIILVDDGSPDNCPDICDSFAAKDDRVKVIHKANGGLSDARNVGILSAKGEYFCFVDSDDSIAPTMIEKLCNAIKNSGAQMAITNFRVLSEQGERIYAKEDSPIKDGVFSACDLLPKIYQQFGWYYIVAWNKLYHRSIFDQMNFPKGKIHEDEYVVAQAMWSAQQIACISDEEYFYTYQRSGSIMASRKAKAHCDWLEALYLRFLFCSEIHGLEQVARETRAVYFRELHNMYFDAILTQGIDKQQRRRAKQQYHAMKGKTRTEKINWLIFQISPALDKRLIEWMRR